VLTSAAAKRGCCPRAFCVRGLGPLHQSRGVPADVAVGAGRGAGPVRQIRGGQPLPRLLVLAYGVGFGLWGLHCWANKGYQVLAAGVGALPSLDRLPVGLSASAASGNVRPGDYFA
jgi:hypothetical protein